MFKDFESKISQCFDCELRKGATQVVVGSGSKNANVIIVGEAPGKTEDQTGIPFSGKSGQILTNGLVEVGYDRSNIYITNIIKCRPPSNRTPTVAEMKVCSKHTETILDAINPEMVVAVGNTAITYFLGDTKLRPKDVIDTIIVSKERLKRKKGVTLRYVYCMRHPAYALHSRDPVIREQIEETIRHIPVALEKVRNIMKSKNRMKEKE